MSRLLPAHVLEIKAEAPCSDLGLPQAGGARLGSSLLLASGAHPNVPSTPGHIQGENARKDEVERWPIAGGSGVGGGGDGQTGRAASAVMSP